MPNYTNQRLTPTNKHEFFTKFLSKAKTPIEKAFLVVLYYWGCRVSEALSLRRKDVILDQDKIYLKITRLKKSKQNAPVPMLRSKPGINWLVDRYLYGMTGDQVFPYSRTWAWELCRRFGLYPHFFRLNRITHDSRHGVAYVKRRISITARAIDYYLGLVDLEAHLDEVE